MSDNPRLTSIWTWLEHWQEVMTKPGAAENIGAFIMAMEALRLTLERPLGRRSYLVRQTQEVEMQADDIDELANRLRGMTTHDLLDLDYEVVETTIHNVDDGVQVGEV